MLSILLAVAAASPHPSEVRTFRDWTVACDNGLACEAIALLPPEEEWEEWTTLSFRRGPRAADRPVVSLRGVEGRPAALLIDGRPFQATFPQDDDGFTIRAGAADLVGALRNGQVLDVRSADGASLGRISLAGASAAMLYMDERQRRVGTVTALVSPGPRPASAIPAPPQVPRIVSARPPIDPPLTLSAQRIAALRRELGCTIDEVGGPDEVETDQIATGRTLILLACGSGAYNLTSVPVIARFGAEGSGEIVTEIASFDSQWGIAAEGRPTLINASWDSERSLLREYSKARGLGDCGTRADYAWDGTRFRLVRQEEMEECRGSLYYVTTWRAEMVGR